MSPTPTGRLFGNDLVLTRTFRAPIDDVWASVTEPDRTARWYGPWKGEAGPGRTIQVQMVQEEGQPWSDMTIDACEPPRRLALAAGEWHLELELTERGGVTELRFTQHLTGAEGAGVEDIGPGWEFYLDALVAAREDGPKPDFDDYYPSMKGYYEAQQ
ncbi:SRPBCC family protein [Dactylosporangium matsuzakiense]|uniref:ATPase n=1 Tax=Dactylosporangium matsuzakiense TaxID=53360 RepID=A0A9W6KFF0_9ACTN|nr:SRPBCC family protein [Dactylosporangium matsuzakiense]UWZ45017.1 SRPBCC family protein [Dactylosporangium matsuzakiense]GLK99059.1 ATPase [Dactylosporangium matsuzakiense]